VLDELDFQRGANVDQETAVQVGKLIGVHTILIGSFTKIGGKIRLDTRLVRIETGELIKADKITKKADDFFELIDEAAVGIAKDLDIEVSKAAREAIEEPGNRSLDAMEHYCHGLWLQDRGEYHKAYEEFVHALTLNPDYERAEQRVAALRPLVG
jgi:hypothetical protein